MLFGRCNESSLDPRALRFRYYSGLFGADSNKEPLQYRIFPLELKPADETSVRDALAKNQPVVVHLSEGVDASAARELRMADAHQFLKPGFIMA